MRRAEEPAVRAEVERRARLEAGDLLERRAGPGHAAHRLAQLAHHVGIDAGLGHRLVGRRLLVAACRDGAQALAGAQIQNPLAGRGVEQRDAVAEAGGDPAAVAAERQRRGPEVGEVQVESGLRQRPHLAPRAGLDQGHGSFQRVDPGRQQLAVGAERDAAHAHAVGRRQLLQLATGRDLEHAQRALHVEALAAALDELGDDQAAVRAEAQIGGAGQVAGELERLHFLAGRDVDDAQGPGAQATAEAHDAVLVGEASAQGRQPAVRRQGRGDLIHGPGRGHALRARVGPRSHGGDLPFGDQVVDLDLAVAERRQPPAVVAEHHVLDGARVRGHPRRLSRHDVPEAYRRVGAAGGDPSAVGGNGRGQHRLIVPGQRPEHVAGGRIPDLQRHVLAAGHDEPTVGTERQGIDRRRVPGLQHQLGSRQGRRLRIRRRRRREQRRDQRGWQPTRQPGDSASVRCCSHLVRPFAAPRRPPALATSEASVSGVRA